jgi:hypothetical protein
MPLRRSRKGWRRRKLKRFATSRTDLVSDPRLASAFLREFSRASTRKHALTAQDGRIQRRKKFEEINQLFVIDTTACAYISEAFRRTSALRTVPAILTAGTYIALASNLKTAVTYSSPGMCSQSPGSSPQTLHIWLTNIPGLDPKRRWAIDTGQSVVQISPSCFILHPNIPPTSSPVWWISPCAPLTASSSTKSRTLMPSSKDICVSPGRSKHRSSSQL